LRDQNKRHALIWKPDHRRFDADGFLALVDDTFPMNKRFPSLLAAVIALAALPVHAAAAPEIGQSAPDFTLTDINGQKHSLTGYKGKTVVLEWVNPDCPFVRKHYDKSGNIPDLQQSAAADGVVWLQINSAASGLEGDYDAARAAAWQQRIHVAATGYFRDQDGRVGKLYDARTTPHLFIINPQGTLVYAGGIDSIRSADPTDIAKATNYVREALADLKAGRAIRTPASKPYGCSVKYAN
jgi:cytochrome oxidase Cu insertion factor (SCO1/SenC/PrrC family)